MKSYKVSRIQSGVECEIENKLELLQELAKTWATKLHCRGTCLKAEGVKARAACLISITTEPTFKRSRILELIHCTREKQSKAKVTCVKCSSLARKTEWRSAKASAISGSKSPKGGPEHARGCIAPHDPEPPHPSQPC